jgi:hypothetical protein
MGDFIIDGDEVNVARIVNGEVFRNSDKRKVGTV